MDVSVVIPCRNGEAFLGPTLDSVLNQTRPPREVIVVDNGSTDSSLALARSYGGIVRALSAPSGGAPAARNRGAALAGGEALMFLDADDLLGLTALENLAAILERHPDAVACCPWYRLEMTGDCWHSAPASCAPRRAGQDDLGAWLTGWYQPPCSVLWSRAAYQRSGGWDADIRVNQDGDIMMRGFVAGNRLVTAGEGAAYYRRLPNGQVSLSGTRATREGVESRLFVLRRIAGMLEQRGRLRRYRGPLGEAFAAVAADCRDRYPDLLDSCTREVRRHAGPRWRRAVRRVPARIARKTAHIQRRLYFAIGPPPTWTGSRAGPAVRSIQPEEDIAAPDGPKVSVVIPTYNRAHLLRRALDSVFAQTYGNFELLLIDDGSTDDTAGLVAGYDDPRLRYLRQDGNRGVAAARNRGMREASGSLIAFLDSDDEWLPEKLARHVAVFEANPPSVGLIYSGVETVDAKGGRRVDLPVHRGLMHGQLLLSNVLVGGSCAMVRRSVVATVGYFDESLTAIEDYEYWLRIARFYRFEVVPAPLVRYYDVTGGPEGSQRRSRSFAANFNARDAFYRRNRHEMERFGVEHLFLLESAKRHLRWPQGDHETGRRLALRAVAARPLAPALYPWLIYALLPRGSREPAVAVLRCLGLPASGRRRPSEQAG